RLHEKEAIMAETVCALLRGINVNGVAIRMEALRAAFAELGFPGAKTVLATGNVVFSDAEHVGEAGLKRRVEAGLSARFAYGAHAFLRSKPEIDALLTAAEEIGVPEGCHLYALFFDVPEAASELPELFASAPRLPGERLAVQGRDAFWTVPKGSTTDSAFGEKILGSRKYRTLTTSRNINTVQKIAALMRVD
ncbi:MAG TPA: DUF1697 domain-containing protein, partial [Clostridia bacterium]|nr:DUF1697 domain-containing protein [Clostridia bacterium]